MSLKEADKAIKECEMKKQKLESERDALLDLFRHTAHVMIWQAKVWKLEKDEKDRADKEIVADKKLKEAITKPTEANRLNELRNKLIEAQQARHLTSRMLEFERNKYIKHKTILTKKLKRIDEPPDVHILWNWIDNIENELASISNDSKRNALLDLFRSAAPVMIRQANVLQLKIDAKEQAGKETFANMKLQKALTDPTDANRVNELRNKFLEAQEAHRLTLRKLEFERIKFVKQQDILWKKLKIIDDADDVPIFWAWPENIENRLVRISNELTKVDRKCLPLRFWANQTEILLLNRISTAIENCQLLLAKDLISRLPEGDKWKTTMRTALQNGVESAIRREDNATKLYNIAVTLAENTKAFRTAGDASEYEEREKTLKMLREASRMSKCAQYDTKIRYAILKTQIVPFLRGDLNGFRPDDQVTIGKGITCTVEGNPQPIENKSGPNSGKPTEYPTSGPDGQGAIRKYLHHAVPLTFKVTNQTNSNITFIDENARQITLETNGKVKKSKVAAIHGLDAGASRIFNVGLVTLPEVRNYRGFYILYQKGEQSLGSFVCYWP